MSGTAPTDSVAPQMRSLGPVAKVFRAVVKFARTQGVQPSTWRGLALLASACGVALRPEMGEALIALGLAISGVIAVLTSDTPAEQQPPETPEP